MKRDGLLLTAIICLLALTACGNNEPGPGEATRGSEPRVDLSTGYPPGEYRIQVTQQADPQETLLVIRLTVFEPNEQGVSRGQWSYERIRFSRGGRVVDTESPGSAGIGVGPAQIHGVLKALTQARIDLVFDRSGLVTEVDGLEEFWARIGAAPVLRQALSADQIRMMINNRVRLSPGEPVGQGARWYPDISFETPLLGQAETETEMELVELTGQGTDRRAELRQTSRITADQGQSMQIGGVSASVDSVDMTVTGTVEVVLDPGYVSRVEQQMQGTATVSVTQGGEEQTTRVEKDSTQTVRTERIGPAPEPTEAPAGEAGP